MPKTLRENGPLYEYVGRLQIESSSTVQPMAAVYPSDPPNYIGGNAKYIP